MGCPTSRIAVKGVNGDFCNCPGKSEYSGKLGVCKSLSYLKTVLSPANFVDKEIKIAFLTQVPGPLEKPYSFKGVKTIDWEVFSLFSGRGVPMAKSKTEKGKKDKKKPVVKKASKGPSGKDKKKAPPKKTKPALTRKPGKKTAPKGKKQTQPKMKKTKDKEEDFSAAFMRSLESKRTELKETLERLMHSRKEYEGELTAGDFID